MALGCIVNPVAPQAIAQLRPPVAASLIGIKCKQL